ncbi:hypothetical protein [Yoonia sp. 2307UL14-13]|uniref:hypothetical protein n=1 Tax=Yoonia sp. 2307UL14-13 TaxID=3126506 RepID=UPI0030A6D203
MAGVNELFERLIKISLSEKEVNSDKWDGLSIIFNVDASGAEEVKGYLFEEEAWSGFLPDSNLPDLVLTLRSLREALKGDARDGWASGLFKIDLREMDVDLEVDYDNPQRWAMTPDNMDTMIEQIRP